MEIDRTGLSNRNIFHIDPIGIGLKNIESLDQNNLIKTADKFQQKEILLKDIISGKPVKTEYFRKKLKNFSKVAKKYKIEIKNILSEERDSPIAGIIKNIYFTYSFPVKKAGNNLPDNDLLFSQTLKYIKRKLINF